MCGVGLDLQLGLYYGVGLGLVLFTSVVEVFSDYKNTYVLYFQNWGTESVEGVVLI